MGYEVWVAGFPSTYGGADTELDHLIDLFRDHDVAVNLVPMFGTDHKTVASVLSRGCAIHDYRPYFNSARVDSAYREWDGHYGIGRISRDDQGKFAADTWRIFDRVLVPPSLRKKVHMLGYGDNAAAKCGPPPMDWTGSLGRPTPLPSIGFTTRSRP